MMKISIISLIKLAWVLLLFIAVQVSSVMAEQSLNKPYSNYKVEEVFGLSLNKRVLLGGKVVSSAEVSLSAQVSGDVLNIKGKEGDMFEKGTTLIRLEQKSIQAQKEVVYAEISSAQEALRNASVQYSQSVIFPNSNSMFGSIPGMFSMFTDPMIRAGRGSPEFDRFANRVSRYTSYQQAKNKLIQARLKLEQVEERLKDANIIAPFDGVIVVKNVNPGDIVQHGQVLMKFANIKKLQVEIDVPSRLVASLKLGKKYRVKLDMTNIVVNARLSQIYPMADRVRHSVKVKFDLPENSPVLAGTYAEVEIFETDSNLLTPIIPETAVMWRSSLPSVFVVDLQTNKTELRFIRLGEKIGNHQKSVLSGLRIGEKIITNPNIMMVSGMDI